MCSRQKLEECLESRQVNGDVGRKLPENRSKFLAETQHALRKKVGQSRFNILDLADVCYELRALDCEDKIVGRVLAPALKTAWSLRRIKRPIQFDRVELSRGELEFALLREILRVKGS